MIEICWIFIYCNVMLVYVIYYLFLAAKCSTKIHFVSLLVCLSESISFLPFNQKFFRQPYDAPMKKMCRKILSYHLPQHFWDTR